MQILKRIAVSPEVAIGEAIDSYGLRIPYRTEASEVVPAETKDG
jgi:hypothetical protein